MRTLQQQFLDEIESFLRRTGMEPTVFGRLALRDPNFVFDLRGGRSPGVKIVDRCRQFMDERAAPDAEAA